MAAPEESAKDHGHSHEHADSSRMVLAAGLNLAITVGQIITGFIAASVGLLGDAAHNLTDTGAVVLALIAMRAAVRPPSGSRTYGGVRWPILAAQANSIVMIGLTVVLGIESIARLGEHHGVRGGLVLVVALAAAIGNGFAAAIVHRPGRDLNRRAVVLHLAADALVSVGVALSGAVILIAPSADWADPVAGLVVSVVIAWQGVRLLKESSLVLLEAVPPGLDVSELEKAMRAVPGVEDVHDLHVWSLSERSLAASAHVKVGGGRVLRDARVISDAVKQMMLAEFGIGHTTLEIE